MIFDLFCYAVATVSVLAIVGSYRSTKQPIAQPIEPTFPELEQLDEQDDNWMDDPGLFLPAEQWEPSEGDRALVEAHTAFIAQYWAAVPTDNVIPFRRERQVSEDLEAIGIRELRKLYTQRGCSGLRLSRATKAQLVDVLKRSA